MKKRIDIFIYIFAVALMVTAFLSYFSFNYFYLYGHIESVSDLLFCLVGWFKLAGIAIVCGAVFIKSQRLRIVLKYFYTVIPLLSFIWIKRYMGLEKTLSSDTDYIYHQINGFMPKNLVMILFYLEAVLMSLCALFVAIKDGFNFIKEKKSLVGFVPVFLFCMPLNLFRNISSAFNPSTTDFFWFKNFGLWHILALIAIVVATYLVYLFLKDKDKEKRHKYLSMLCVVMLVQYMSRASMLIGDGYNTYKSLLSFAPLFVCNIGVFIVSLAIFLRSKALMDLSFFIHAAGAISVFAYFGKESMSAFDTVFSYTFLYFTLTHALLFICCVMPALLKEHTFKLRQCAFPLIYYAVFLFMASVFSQLISATTFYHGQESYTIYPNFSFTQISPIEITLPQAVIKILGLKFDLIYLLVLFGAYIAIFFLWIGLYHFSIGRRMTKKQVRAAA